MLPAPGRGVQSNFADFPFVPALNRYHGAVMRTRLRHVLEYSGFVVRQAFLSFLNNRGLEKASVLAYNSFFALFPLLLFLLFIAGRTMVSSTDAMEAVEQLLDKMLPVFSDTIIREVEGLSVHRGWGWFSILLLLWGVTPLAGAIRGAFDQIYRRDRPLPFLKEKLLDGLAVLLMLVLLVLLVAGEIAYAVVGSFLAGKMPLVLRLFDVAAPLVVTVSFLSVVYYCFAPVRLRLPAVLAGGFVTALLLGLMGPVFTAIMQFNPQYGYAFGSLKAVFLLLVWIYYAFVVILLGIEVSANIHWREASLVRELLAAPEKRHRYARRLGRHTRGYDAGHVVFREGDAGDSMFYILSGTVTLQRGGATLRTMKPGDYFGEMAMLLRAPRTATATVAEAGTELVTISAENMDAVLRQNPKVVLALLEEMARRLKVTDEMLPP